MDQQQIDYQQLAGALLSQQMALNGGADRPNPLLGFKADVSSTPSTIYGHGPGGLFSYPGMDPKVFSAMLLPMTGLQSILPVFQNNDSNPVYGLLTGVTATTGSNPTGPCDDPPVAGLAKLCLHSFQWGLFSRQTRVFNILRVGEVVSRADFTDYQLYGNALGVGPRNPNIPTIAGADPAAVGKNEMSKATFELAVAWARDFARVLYAGNPTNNTSGGGYAEFYGLDYLINTGYRDAVTSVVCPAADSLVRSFGDLRIDQGTNGQAFVNLMTYMYRNIGYIAERVGLNPVTWVIAMRYGAFYEATRVWPIAYYTNRDTVSGANMNQFVVNDGIALQNARDDMFNNRYLLIDGQKVPVILDESIAETTPAPGVYESQVYFVPLTVLGGTPVTFMEAFDFNAPGAAMDFARVFTPEGSFYASDGGRFLWNRPAPTNACVQLRAWTKPRLVLTTPHIAARLTDVRYSPTIHERDSFTDGGYFADGGGTNYQGYPGVAPSLFSPTA